jgi:uncharacterized protein Yka (UPF0111/DUF47 family)
MGFEKVLIFTLPLPGQNPLREQSALRIVKDNLNKIKPEEIQRLLVKYLTEIKTCAQIIRSLPPIEESDAESSRLYTLVQEIQDILLPRYNSIEQVFSLLFKNSPEWYNCQRYILRSQTYYREQIDDEVEGVQRTLTDSTFGLEEIKSEVSDIEADVDELEDALRHVAIVNSDSDSRAWTSNGTDTIPTSYDQIRHVSLTLGVAQCNDGDR